jgi:Domain of unknown function (DUF5069)
LLVIWKSHCPEAVALRNRRATISCPPGTFKAISERVSRRGTDQEILDWCFQTGQRPTTEEIEIWNGFMEKRGWRDPMSQMLREELAAKEWSDRDDIKTLFDFFDADEERPLKAWD